MLPIDAISPQTGETDADFVVLSSHQQRLPPQTSLRYIICSIEEEEAEALAERLRFAIDQQQHENRRKDECTDDEGPPVAGTSSKTSASLLFSSSTPPVVETRVLSSACLRQFHAERDLGLSGGNQIKRAENSRSILRIVRRSSSGDDVSTLSQQQRQEEEQEKEQSGRYLTPSSSPSPSPLRDVVIIVHFVEGRTLLTDADGLYNGALVSCAAATKGNVFLCLSGVPPPEPISDSAPETTTHAKNETSSIAEADERGNRSHLVHDDVFEELVAGGQTSLAALKSMGRLLGWPQQQQGESSGVIGGGGGGDFDFAPSRGGPSARQVSRLLAEGAKCSQPLSLPSDLRARVRGDGLGYGSDERSSIAGGVVDALVHRPLASVASTATAVWAAMPPPPRSPGLAAIGTALSSTWKGWGIARKGDAPPPATSAETREATGEQAALYNTKD